MSPAISRAMPQRVMSTAATTANAVRSRRPDARTMPRKMTAKNGLARMSFR